MIHITISYDTFLSSATKNYIEKDIENFLLKHDKTHFYRACLAKKVCYVTFVESADHRIIGVPEEERQNTAVAFLGIVIKWNEQKEGYFYNSQGLVRHMQELLGKFFAKIVVA